MFKMVVDLVLLYYEQHTFFREVSGSPQPRHDHAWGSKIRVNIRLGLFGTGPEKPEARLGQGSPL